MSELRHFDVVVITDGTALTYAQVRVALMQSSRPIPASDAWIAALALQHGLSILSRDQHFDVVPDVKRTTKEAGPFRQSVGTDRVVGATTASFASS